MSHLVFVYGTLKKGNSNHPLLQNNNAEFISNATTTPDYTMYNGSFPYLTLGGKNYINGEVYAVSDSCLNQLDLLEGVDYDHYDRVKKVVTIWNDEDDHYSEEVWIYVASPNTQRMLEHGRQMDVINTKDWEPITW